MPHDPADTPTAPIPPNRADPPPPSSARYRVEDLLGRGGMGAVYLAEDQALGRSVAVKLLTDDSAEAERRFALEAQIGSQLDHGNVPPVHDLTRDALGRPLLVMKRIRDALSLGDLIAALRRDDDDPLARAWTFQRRVQVIQEVCHALEHAHQRGVLHRDIKPENIVLGPDREVFLVDWGIADLVDSSSEDPPGDASVEVDPADQEFVRAQDAGAVVGTPAYLAPERVIEGSDSVASDLYALTVVLYEFLTLHHPLEADLERLPPELAAVEGTVTNAERYVVPVQGRIPRPLWRVCRRGLSKQPERRYPSAAALEQDLQAWVEGNFAVVCPGTWIQRALGQWSYWIDQLPVAFPAFTIVLAATLLASVLHTILTWV